MKDSKYEKGLLNEEWVDIEKIYCMLDKEKEKVYEIIRIIDGRPLFFEDHIDRLNNSLSIIGLNYRVTYDQMRKVIKTVLNEFGNKNINLKIALYNNGSMNMIVYLVNSFYPKPEKYVEGYHTLLIYEEREKPNAKILNNEQRRIINEILHEEGADECICVSEKGEILEGSRSNLFFVKGSTIITPPDNGVLLGTTRNKIIELCEKAKINIQKRTIRIEELTFVDGLFVTGTSIDVMPVNSVGTLKYKSSSNRMVEKVMKLYQMEVNKYIAHSNF